MSSNIQIQRICQYCGKEFTARTTVTRSCSQDCSRKLHRQRQKEAMIIASNKETLYIKRKPLEELKEKEFLTVKDVGTLLNCSIRTAYRLIELGNIRAVNIGERKTLIKRAEIDKLFQ